MKVSKAYLEQRVEELQCWIDLHPAAVAARSLREHNKRYYIQKLVLADEQNADFVEL